MSEKILIADDEPSNRKILEQELVHRGFAVDTAGGSKEALAKVESAPPDLLILDYMMPDLSGLAELKDLRSNMLSARSASTGSYRIFRMPGVRQEWWLAFFPNVRDKTLLASSRAHEQHAHESES